MQALSSDNGKPAVTQGRKARGPTNGRGAARLPNWGVRVTRRLVSTIFAGALLTALSVVPSNPPSAPDDSFPEFVAAGSSDNRCWNYKPSERGFTKKMNEERARTGDTKMSLDPELSKAARVHTNEMIRRNELYHTTSSDLRNRVTNWVVLGENVGVGGTVSSLHSAFMNSPAHRDNILHNAYRHVGVGVKKAGDRMWVTVIFEALTDPGTSLSMPRC